MMFFRFLKSALTATPHAARPVPGSQPEINALIEAHLRGDPRAFGEIVSRFQVHFFSHLLLSCRLLCRVLRASRPSSWVVRHF